VLFGSQSIGDKMSKKRIEALIKKMERKTAKQRAKELAHAKKQAKEEQKLAGGIGKAASLGIKVYAGATGATIATGAVTGTAAAAGGLGGVSSVLLGGAAVAPPFSTALMAVAGIGLAAWGGIKAGEADRKKWLSGDGKVLNAEIKKYKKKKSKWRKKEMAKLLRAYDKHLSLGNKKTLSPLDGNLRNKDEANWRAKKAKLEIRMKALYAVEHAKSYKKLKKGLKPPKITKKQADAEQRIVKRIKRKQANSIDPRTSPFPLLAPGVVGITPKLATVDALQSRVSDTAIIKLARMNPSPSAFKQISQSHDQAVAIMKAPEKDLPKELQQPKKDNKALIIGVSAVSALLVVGGAVVLARK